MGKTAFLFSGQGAQKPGMCADLRSNETAQGVFVVASKVLGYDVAALCAEGPQEKLNETLYTQPSVLACDIAAACALMELGHAPDGFAGFSLGEVAALAVAHAFSHAEAFRLVAKRAAYMQEACAAEAGGMAAVIGGDAAGVDALCGEVGGIWAVNYNCPGQTVVAGRKEALAAFADKAAEQKLRVMPLPVSGAFHTELMASASAKLAADLAETRWMAPSMPVYGNTAAEPYPAGAEEGRALLAGQLMRPVRWEDTIRRMVADGFTTFIECGPGGTLTGFFKRMKLDGIEAKSYETLF